MQKVNTAYMILIYVTCFISNFGCGYTAGGYNQAGLFTEIKMEWTHTSTVMITSSGMFGMMLGSLLCEKFLSYGRLNSTLIANALIIFGSIP